MKKGIAIFGKSGIILISRKKESKTMKITLYTITNEKNNLFANCNAKMAAFFLETYCGFTASKALATVKAIPDNDTAKYTVTETTKTAKTIIVEKWVFDGENFID